MRSTDRTPAPPRSSRRSPGAVAAARALVTALAMLALLLPATSGSAASSRASRAGSVPRHIATWLEYPGTFGRHHTNETVPAAWIAAHADGIAVDQWPVHRALTAAYHRARPDGEVNTYVDFTYYVGCSQEQAQRGEIATGCGADGGWPPATRETGLTLSDAMFLHDEAGARIVRTDTNQIYYNPLSPALHRFIERYTRWLATSPAGQPGTSSFMFDDSGFMSGYSWCAAPMTSRRTLDLKRRFGHTNTCNVTDQQATTFMHELWQRSYKPVTTNIGDGRNLSPDAVKRYVAGRDNLKAAMVEEFAFDPQGGGTLGWGHPGSGYLLDGDWTKQMNNLSTIELAQHTPLILWLESGSLSKASSGPRTYMLASLWLLYEPGGITTALVQYDNIGTTLNDQPVTYTDEFNIVPRDPIETVVPGEIGSLARNGAYVREFAHCDQTPTDTRGNYSGPPASIGRCAAVVNPSSTATVTLPAFAGGYRYHHSLRLDDQNAYFGGKAAFTGPVPERLGPNEAVILR